MLFDTLFHTPVEQFQPWAHSRLNVSKLSETALFSGWNSR